MLFPRVSHEVMGLDAMILVFWMLSFKPTFSLSSFTFIKRLFSSSSLSAKGVVSSAYLRYWHFSQKSWFQFVLHPFQHSHHVLCIYSYILLSHFLMIASFLLLLKVKFCHQYLVMWPWLIYFLIKPSYIMESKQKLHLRNFLIKTKYDSLNIQFLSQCLSFIIHYIYSLSLFF